MNTDLQRMNSSKFSAWLTLITAICISAVAAYFSIDGIIALFSATPWKAGIMITVLEIGKIVTAVWLHHNWGIKGKLFLKGYLVAALVLLMGITSMGIFGTLSKSFMDHSLVAQGVKFDQELIDQQIQALSETRDTRMSQVAELNRYIDVYLNSGNVNTARMGVRLAQRQQEQRDMLQADIDRLNAEISELTKRKFESSRQFAAVENEIGPVLYVAELIYGNKTEDVVEKAVRFVILVIVICFDPLAILLLVASQISFSRISYYNGYVKSDTIEETEFEPKPEIKLEPIVRESIVSDLETQVEEIKQNEPKILSKLRKKLERKVERIESRNKEQTKEK